MGIGAHGPANYCLFAIEKDKKRPRKSIHITAWELNARKLYTYEPCYFFTPTVILLCFNTCSKPSFLNVEQAWYSAVQALHPKTPIILVGTKSDLREDPEALIELKHDGHGSPVLLQEGEALARKIGAVRYVECSSRTLEGVPDVFQEAIAVVNPKSKWKAGCTIQ
ncbi:ras-domain-containing protein [Sistotremastrum suecicum HHB10207 ss-3]|uniref:Ras-domain-containing protein n=1 Tax=Sistotremastrum suecicum HHB10207 ss-3 TaxID=1314776 RepID=A0A166BPJ7_9AGAM|nr:ras-domain-containing protein [Sistotremastrum suecicum HHB10207 ss-3]